MILVSIITNAISNLIEEFSKKTNVRVSADNNRTEAINGLPVLLNYELVNINPINERIGDLTCKNASFSCAFRFSKVRDTKDDINIYGEYLLSLLRNNWLVTLDDFISTDKLKEFALESYLKNKYLIQFRRVTPKLDRENRVESLLLICEFTITTTD